LVRIKGKGGKGQREGMGTDVKGGRKQRGNEEEKKRSGREEASLGTGRSLGENTGKGTA
jgi:hypothetical protein